MFSFINECLVGKEENFLKMSVWTWALRYDKYRPWKSSQLPWNW